MSPRWGSTRITLRPAPFREDPDPFTLVCVGRLCPAKGQYLLLTVKEKLIAEGRSVQLRLVGDGPDRQALQDGVLGQEAGGLRGF